MDQIIDATQITIEQNILEELEAKNDGDESMDSTKKKKYGQKFCDQWLQVPLFKPWIKKIINEDGVFQPWCGPCNRKISCAKTALLRHTRSKSHIMALGTGRANSAPTTFSPEILTPYAYVSRSEHFSACHRLHSNELTDVENRELFGKCNNINGHGHNYELEVVIYGPIDPVTGMVMNITELKQDIEKTVMNQLDHKNIDLDVPYFKNVVSTTENLAVFIWKQLKSIMKKPELLCEVRLHETAKNLVVYRGE